MTVTVVIVEDQPETLAHLGAVVDAHGALELAGTAATVEAGRALVAARPPTVLLTDLGLPDGSGIDLIRHTTDTYPHVLTMVLSMLGDESNVVDAILAGAKGYLLKGATDHEITEGIVGMMDGASPISPGIARFLLVKLQRQEQDKGAVATRPDNEPERHRLLSPREGQVMELIAQGYRSKEIAAHLNISYHTVVHHIRSVYDKLAVTSRSQAIFRATELGELR